MANKNAKKNTGKKTAEKKEEFKPVDRGGNPLDTKLKEKVEELKAIDVPEHLEELKGATIEFAEEALDSAPDTHIAGIDPIDVESDKEDLEKEEEIEVPKTKRRARNSSRKLR